MCLTISGPSSQKAVRTSTRVRGMVKEQSRMSVMARFAMKMFRGVCSPWDRGGQRKNAIIGLD